MDFMDFCYTCLLIFIIFLLIGGTLALFCVGMVYDYPDYIIKEEVDCYDENDNIIKGLTCVNEIRCRNDVYGWFGNEWRCWN